MVIFLRSLDCNPDPRVQKYCDYLDREKVDYHILCWDRSEKLSNDRLHSYFRKTAEYGTGLKNIYGILKFNQYLIKQLYRKRKSYKIIHACDFDTILPALLFKVLFRKTVIYDIFDWFVDSRHFNNKILKNIILLIEKIALKLSDATIICDEERKSQLNYIPKVLWVLPNIPNFKSKRGIEKSLLEETDDKIRLSYVGTMPADRGIDKLLECVKNNPQLELNIAGFGIMDKLVREYSDKCQNIHFYGTVPYEKGMEIMRNSDIIVAIYEKLVLNNVYAAPNKYYEGLYLGKPILTTQGTLVGAHTEKYKTGFVIGESYEDMNSLFKQENLLKLAKQYGENASRIWNEKYKHYVNNFMDQTYGLFIKTKL